MNHFNREGNSRLLKKYATTSDRSRAASYLSLQDFPHYDRKQAVDEWRKCCQEWNIPFVCIEPGRHETEIWFDFARQRYTLNERGMKSVRDVFIRFSHEDKVAGSAGVDLTSGYICVKNPYASELIDELLSIILNKKFQQRKYLLSSHTQSSLNARCCPSLPSALTYWVDDNALEEGRIQYRMRGPFC